MSLVQFQRDRIRAEIEVTQKSVELIDAITTSTMRIWRGTDVQFEIALLFAKQLIDISGYSSIRVEARDYATRSGLNFMDKTVSAGQFNTAMELAQWKDGSSQQVVVPFTAAETNIDLLGQITRDLWLVVSGIPTSSPARQITLQGGKLIVQEDGDVPSDIVTPALGASLIPVGAVYDAFGHYAIAVQANKNHGWVKSTNDTSVTNGTETISATGNFVSQGTSVTLNGTANALVTATLRYPQYFTADEGDARYLNGVLKIMNEPGVLVGTQSVNKRWNRWLGVDDNGRRIDQVVDILNPMS